MWVSTQRVCGVVCLVLCACVFAEAVPVLSVFVQRVCVFVFVCAEADLKPDAWLAMCSASPECVDHMAS